MCLGKNGGYSQIGGYDCQGHLEEVKWFPMLQQKDFKINVAGLSLNDHPIDGSE
jgi:hypothetical protein